MNFQCHYKNQRNDDHFFRGHVLFPYMSYDTNTLIHKTCSQRYVIRNNKSRDCIVRRKLPLIFSVRGRMHVFVYIFVINNWRTLPIGLNKTSLFIVKINGCYLFIKKVSFQISNKRLIFISFVFVSSLARIDEANE